MVFTPTIDIHWVYMQVNREPTSWEPIKQQTRPQKPEKEQSVCSRGSEMTVTGRGRSSEGGW